MIAQSKEKVMLDVPYFEQTRYSTCGPASLMMVLKFWDPLFTLSHGMEFLLWMKSNPFVFLGGTLQFGLASTAVRLGYKACIVQQDRFSVYHPSKPRFFDWYERFVSRRARRLKIPVQYKNDVFGMIGDALRRGIPPIVFVNLQPLVGENVLHWVVVTGLDEKMVYVNDPYVPFGFQLKEKKGYPVVVDVFQEAMATDIVLGLRLPPCLILIEK